MIAIGHLVLTVNDICESMLIFTFTAKMVLQAAADEHRLLTKLINSFCHSRKFITWLVQFAFYEG